MTKLQTWTMTGLGTVALLVGVLMATGTITSAQSPTPTPSVTEDTTDGGATPTPDATDDGTDGDDQSDSARVSRGCGGKIGVKIASAEVLGLTEDELRTQLQAGQTLAEIAQGQGMTVEDFQAALVAAVTADLQAQFDAGDITQEEFDTATTNLSDKINAIINAEGGLRFRGPGPGFEGGTRFRNPPADNSDANNDA